MNKKLAYIILSSFFLLQTGCHKNHPDNYLPRVSTSIIGLWEIRLLTVSHYNSSGQLVKIDTVVYTNNLGQPVTMFEEYASGQKFNLFQSSINDTLISGTFIQTGNTIKINLSDELFPFNNRTITKVDASSMEMYQVFSEGSGGAIWIQQNTRREQ